MPAPPLANTFESGQSDGTVITTGNSGGAAGDAFSAVLGSPTYSTAQAKRGTLSQRIDTTATYTETNTQWTGLGSILTSVWYRWYMYMTAYPSGTPQAIRLNAVRTSANANSSFLSFGASGVVALNAAQAGIAGTVGTVPIALSQWVRIEWRVLSSTTVGEAEWWLYNTADAPIASFDDHKSGTGAVLGANTDGIRWGAATVNGSNSFVFWMDDVAVSTTGQIGPSQTARPSLPSASMSFFSRGL